ncbi:NADP-dependent malic enzyme [Faecalicoccus pleomorphus]|uniref:NAD(P)-dependent malic enzyme n=1 Tax=Faecalicoccus pleomorphus TaxID=1323 RepID=UPI0014308D6C|nr:NADP-dependent malic enzyme [Faecalicoccus pleomorphus]MDB7986269.1 NADP-dependent malic enzyme [Faecalicoccus pleomorphus]MDB7990283.1 NADP-dependent malic enzyme [Faecalicoccus pleomorphus]NJE40411.1 NADP-dependent malic enzyme [Faecalicoccus pleomorphus]
MDYAKEALRLHKEWSGKLEIVPKMSIETKNDLSVAYTPGVAAPCLAIHEDARLSYTYTGRGHTIAVISDGSAVLGLGNIGPEAGMPVMEGKCVLFKALSGLDAIPLCLNTQDTDKLVDIIAALEPSFGGINLEDIAAPRCFEVEQRLKERMNIPVFHDDQHGTAIVTCSALVNALRLVKKKDPEIVIMGAGSAGCAIASLILDLELGNVVLLNRQGILQKDMPLSSGQKALIDRLNKNHKTGGLKEAMKGADVFIGVSAPHIVSKDMVRSMNEKAIVFPMANPTPEIEPQDAKEANAYIVGTGRSDHPNQINNLLAFPGIFKGALEAQATEINYEMKKAAVFAIASMIPEAELSPENIIVSALDPRVVPVVTKAVKQAAIDSGVIRKWNQY